MAIESGSLLGGVFKAEQRIVEDIAAGSSGDILSIPVPTGKLIRIFGCVTTTTNAESLMKLTSDGVIYSEGSLAESSNFSASVTVWAISNGVGSSGAASSSAATSNEVIVKDLFTLTKTSGSTTNIIRVGYEIGVKA